MTLRLAFMGTPDFAVPTLAEIVGAGHEVVAVYTQPPRPAGRGMEDRPSPVHAFADEAGIAVRTPLSLKTDEALREFDSLDVDAAVVVAYGQILPGSILAAPREGCFNLHASLLPRWRGAAPIHRAIMAGDTETGVMVMRMEEGLDTGPVCMAERVGIETNETTGMLHDRLSRLGAGLMGRALGALERGSLDCRPQSEDGVTYAAKIDKAEARIDWARTADEVHNHIRGLSPFPGAWFEFGDGDRGVRVKVLASVREDAAGVPGEVLDERLTIACGSGAVRLTAVQRAGKAKMDAETFLRGSPIAVGSRLVT